mmetsp:Transcript_20205/g.30625  ORF Transcript_20205/g.30625 Transcript_20205/m.30625 type:complete len:346 (-) Transcript_20205:84-1121(-)
MHLLKIFYGATGTRSLPTYCNTMNNRQYKFLALWALLHCQSNAFECYAPDRRAVVMQTIGSAILSTIAPSAFALENNAENSELSMAQPLGPDGESSRPSAPIEYLLPAARVGIYIYQLVALVEGFHANDQSSEGVAKLEKLLLSSPRFIRASDQVDVSRDDPYKNALPIAGEIGVAKEKQKERQANSVQVGLLPQFFEVGELVGERRQWNQLRATERERENASEVRRALNIYTTNLNFNRNKYEWKGSKEEKRKRIRSDQLPTTTDVIRSDLDTRDLYRNQVQTALDDAKAEYLYQKRESGDDASKFDFTELLGILKQAQIAIDKWFNFIPKRDVQSALELAKQG